jgi:hypothetical protein
MSGCDCPPGVCEVCRKLAEMLELTLMHADDGTPCRSLVANDAGTLRCTEHGRAVYGSGWNAGYFEALEQQ